MYSRTKIVRNWNNQGLLSGHTCGGNTRNNFALEYGIENEYGRRGNKCSGKGETALNVTSLLNDYQPHGEGQYFAFAEHNEWPEQVIPHAQKREDAKCDHCATHQRQANLPIDPEGTRTVHTGCIFEITRDRVEVLSHQEYTDH